MPGCRCTGLPICRVAALPGHRYAGTPNYRVAAMTYCRRNGLPLCRVDDVLDVQMCARCDVIHDVGLLRLIAEQLSNLSVHARLAGHSDLLGTEKELLYA